MAGLGVADLTAGYAAYIQSLPAKPVVIGHSFGGLSAQKLLTDGLAAAAVVLSPAPIKGATKLPLAQIRSALPVLRNPRNKARAVALTARQFRYGFGNALTTSESRRLFDAFAIPGPGRPVFELTAAKKDSQSPTAVDTTTGDRGPLLITGAPGTTPCRRSSPARPTGCTPLLPQSPTTTSSTAAATHSPSIAAGTKWPGTCCAG